MYGFTCSCPRCLTEADWDVDDDVSSDGEWETDDGEDMSADEMQNHDNDASMHQDMPDGQHSATDASANGVHAHMVKDKEADFGVATSNSLLPNQPAALSSNHAEPMNEAYLQLFMLKYLCPQEHCFGTLCAVFGTDCYECNVCGHKRTEAEFLADLEM